MRSFTLRLATLAVLALTLTLALTACSSGGTATSQPALIASATPYIVDVPVPAGFTMLESSWSQVVEQSKLRFVGHDYSGSDDYLPVVAFYRAQMPTKGWTFISQSQVGETVTLTYKKNNEDAIVTVHQGTWKTHVNVNIKPVGQTISVSH